MGAVLTVGRDASVRFGRRRGWVLHHLWSLGQRAGLFRRLEKIDWPSVRRLVFVCRGNICRSAYAEHRAQAIGLQSASFGLEAQDGREADPRAIEVARNHGIDLGNHRTRAAARFSAAKGDLLIAMEPGQLPPLRTTARLNGSQLTLLGLWSSPGRPYLQDPYGLAREYFNTCFNSIDSAVEEIQTRMAAAAASARQSRRGNHPVLVVQAETLGSLAVIRSLGRAGYPVHACSARPEALGLSSRYAVQRVLSPDYHSPSFLDWLRNYLAAQQISAVVPSESLLLAIRPRFAEFARFICGAEDEATLYAGLSKFDLFSTLVRTSSTADHLPPTVLVEDTSRPPPIEQLRRLPPPLYIKVDGTYSARGENGRVFHAASAEQAHAQLAEIAPRFRKALVQGFVPGRGVGAFFLLHRGELVAEFMHLRLHEIPHTGGTSSLRQSWRHQPIRDDALAKLRSMQWEGVAMMEYRWDRKPDEFHFLEMNGRFWGSLHLALWAGVDFPRLLLDAFCAVAGPRSSEYPLGVRCRHTFPGELQYLWSRWKDSNLGFAAKLWSLLEFLYLGANPRVHSDLLFPGDRALYFRNVKRTLHELQQLVERRDRGVTERDATQRA